MTLAWRIVTGKEPPWQDACVEHDRAYWAGGTSRQRAVADGLLQVRITSRGHPLLALLVWVAVRLGGHPLLPLPWRWGFGYPWPHHYMESNMQNRSALDVVKELRRGLRTERGEDVELARELDALLSRDDFRAFLSTIGMKKP